jgi:hypothetical protein
MREYKCKNVTARSEDACGSHLLEDTETFQSLYQANISNKEPETDTLIYDSKPVYEISFNGHKFGTPGREGIYLEAILKALNNAVSIIEDQNKKIDELERKNEGLFDKMDMRITNIDHRLTQQEYEGVNDDDVKETAKTILIKTKEYIDKKNEELREYVDYTRTRADAGTHNARESGESENMEKQGKTLVEREGEEE